MADPASITIQRRVEWSDTDSAGHQHFTAVLRWAEEAETLLHQRLGIADVSIGHCPRVRIEVDFTQRLPPLSLVDIRLKVARVGRSSVTYAFEVHSADAPAARGSTTAVLVAPGAGAKAWPPHVRRALLERGTMAGERYAET